MTAKTLLLLRHAKSSWDDPSLRDFDRPLAPRGRRAAPLMAAHIEQSELIPEVVLCSAAARARETWELMARLWAEPPPVEYDGDLYGTGPQACLVRLRALDDGIARAMVVGHNPDLEDLAAMLAASGEGDALKRMRKKFPTCALAVIRFEAAGWSEIGPGQGRLTAFVTPKSLV